MGDEDDVAANTSDIMPPIGVGVILHSQLPEVETGKEAISLTLILISRSQPYFPMKQARHAHSCFPKMSSMVLPEQLCISHTIDGLLSVFRTGILCNRRDERSRRIPPDNREKAPKTVSLWRTSSSAAETQPSHSRNQVQMQVWCSLLTYSNTCLRSIRAFFFSLSLSVKRPRASYVTLLSRLASFMT
jgi:hypothetical protein